jgi:hypothetical protein
MEASCAMSDEFERLAPEFLAMARRIFEAGAKAERAKLLALLQQGDTPASEFRAVVHTPRRGSTTYGSVSPLVNDALKELAIDSPDGVGASEIAAYFERRGSGLTEKQVRAALKQLHNTGEANRASRGRYLPRAAAAPPTSGENPDGDTSGHFDLAAE